MGLDRSSNRLYRALAHGEEPKLDAQVEAATSRPAAGWTRTVPVLQRKAKPGSSGSWAKVIDDLERSGSST